MTRPPRASSSSGSSTLVPMADAPPKLSLRVGKKYVKMPRVAYSLYKTSPDQASRGVGLALRAGVKHFDLASDYGSNSAVASALKRYLDVGTNERIRGALTFEGENEAVLERIDAAKHDAERRGDVEADGSLSPPPDGSPGRKGRRERLFLTHKLSNAEQSTDGATVRRAVKGRIAELGCSYLDMVCIHSPLTDGPTRLATYETLLKMRDSGFVKSVGVCNYSILKLREIERAGLELPSMNQLELSPFNAHSDVVEYCGKNGIAVSCAAWSKLSGVDGPSDQWAVLSDLAKAKDVTKAQVLVRWALQKGYVCAPRSGTGSKLERIAIAENSYGGVNPTEKPFQLSAEDMKILDGLDVGYRAGKLGRRDGWTDSDVTGPEWDPTDEFGLEV